MLRTVCKEENALVGHAMEMYKCVKCQVARNEALANVLDSLHAEKEQILIHIDVFTAACRRLTAQKAYLSWTEWCFPSLVTETSELRFNVNCLTSKSASKNSSSGRLMNGNRNVKKLETAHIKA